MLESTYSDQHCWPSFLGLESVSSTPLIIDSIELLRFHDDYIVRATSQEGAVGLAIPNRRIRSFRERGQHPSRGCPQFLEATTTTWL